MKRAIAVIMTLAMACGPSGLVSRAEHAPPMQAVRLAALANIRHELGEGHHGYNRLRRLLLQRGVTSDDLAKLTAATPESLRAWAAFFDWAHASPDEAKRTLELVEQLARTRPRWRLYADSGHNDGTQAKYVFATALVALVVVYIVLMATSGKEPSLPGVGNHRGDDHRDRTPDTVPAASASALVAGTESYRAPPGGVPVSDPGEAQRAEEARREQQRRQREQQKQACLAGIDQCTYGQGVAACQPRPFTNEWTARAELVQRAIPVLHFCKDQPWEECRKQVMAALPTQSELLKWNDEVKQISLDFDKVDRQFATQCSATPPDTETYPFINLHGFGDCATAENCEGELELAVRALERWGHAHECTWNATFYTSRREERDRKISECERLYGADQ